MRASSVLALACILPGCAASAVLSADAEMSFPDRGAHVVADGVRLRYVEAGAGRPVVLIHGAYGGVEDWEATILGDVARLGRAIAFDRPGHGWSGPGCGTSPAAQAALLRDACREIGADRPVVVGFSYGGAVAAAWAAEWPDEVSGLVLLNAPTHPWGGSPSVTDSVACVPGLGEILAANVLTPAAAVLARGYAENAFAPEPVTAAFERSPIPLAIRPAALRENSAEVAALDADLAAQAPRYPRIRCPVTFVVGDSDRIVGPEWHSPRFVAEVAGTRRVVVRGAGHQLPYSRPADCIDAIRDVLAR